MFLWVIYKWVRTSRKICSAVIYKDKWLIGSKTPIEISWVRTWTAAGARFFTLSAYEQWRVLSFRTTHLGARPSCMMIWSVDLTGVHYKEWLLPLEHNNSKQGAEYRISDFRYGQRGIYLLSESSLLSDIIVVDNSKYWSIEDSKIGRHMSSKPEPF